MEDRRIKKRLYEIALKEYKDKRPKEITGYRVKKSVLLQRGYGPSIIISGLGGQLVPFLLLANYGDQYRLYYLVETGMIVNAINVPKNEFERELLKFEKATAKLFQIPKPQVPEKKVEKIKQQLNDKFHNYLALIEKQTSCKLRTAPIITVYQTSSETQPIIKRTPDFIKLPIELLSHNLLEGYLLREAYRLILPPFLIQTDHAKLFATFGAYFHLPKSLKLDWIQLWEQKYALKTLLPRLNDQQFHAFLQFLCYLGKYESEPFEDKQIHTLFTYFPELHKTTQSPPEMAAHCYLKLANHEGLYNLKAALFFILADQSKAAKKVLHELSRFSQSKEIETLRIHAEYLASIHLSKLYSAGPLSPSAYLGMKAIFTDALEFVKKHIIEVKRIHPSEAKYMNPVDITIKLKNVSDLTLQNIKIVDQPSKKTKVAILSPPSFNFSVLAPGKELTCHYQLQFENPQKITFSQGVLTYEDSLGNHYVQSLSATTIQLK